MVSDRMVTEGYTKLSGMIIVITSVGPVIIVSNETFIDHFDAVRVSIFILFYFYTFYKNT